MDQIVKGVIDVFRETITPEHRKNVVLMRTIQHDLRTPKKNTPAATQPMPKKKKKERPVAPTVEQPPPKRQKVKRPPSPPTPSSAPSSPSSPVSDDSEDSDDNHRGFDGIFADHLQTRAGVAPPTCVQTDDTPEIMAHRRAAESSCESTDAIAKKAAVAIKFSRDNNPRTWETVDMKNALKSYKYIQEYATSAQSTRDACRVAGNQGIAAVLAREADQYRKSVILEYTALCGIIEAAEVCTIEKTDDGWRGDYASDPFTPSAANIDRAGKDPAAVTTSCFRPDCGAFISPSVAYPRGRYCHRKVLPPRVDMGIIPTKCGLHSK